MGAKTTIAVTVGVSGSGKTYYRGSVFVVEEWLPNHSGLLITNLPLNMDALEEYWEGASERIEIIPREVLDAWREGSSGPWEYLQERDLSGAKLVIDEIHNYCGKNSSASVRKKWLSFIGELRHQGMTAEFLTQSEAKCAKEILSEAEIRYEIINGENRLFPVLGYRMGDLYELRAKITGKYLCPSFCREYMQASGKWTLQKETMFYRLPFYFKFYDSYSAPEHGKAKGNKAELHPFEKYGWIRLLMWFYLQYPVRISIQFLAVGLFVWMFFMGGVGYVMRNYFNAIEGISHQQIKSVTKSDKEQQEKKKEAPDKKDDESLIRKRIRALEKQKDGDIAYDEQGEQVGKWVVERWVSKVSFATTKYIRLRTGRKISIGDYYNNKRVIIIDLRKRELVFEDLTFIGFEQLDD